MLTTVSEPSILRSGNTKIGEAALLPNPGVRTEEEEEDCDVEDKRRAATGETDESAVLPSAAPSCERVFFSASAAEPEIAASKVLLKFAVRIADAEAPSETVGEMECNCTRRKECKVHSDKKEMGSRAVCSRVRNVSE